MKIPSDEELRLKEEAFKKGRRPDSLGYLSRLRPTLLRFYLDGYSRKSMFDFLTAEGILECSKATFFRWLASNVDFDREAREYEEKNRLAGEGARTPAAADVSGGGDPAIAKAERPPSPDESAASATQAPRAATTSMTTQKTTVESGQAAASSEGSDSKEKSLAVLESALSGIEQREMGAVALRARVKLDDRDQHRGRGDG